MSPDAMPSVWAVVPSFNRCHHTLRFLRAFAAVDYPRKHVVVVDDASTDHTRFNIALNFPAVPVLAGNGRLWWSGGTNAGIRHALAAGADFILTINDDSVMEPDFLARMVACAREDARRIVGCAVLRQDRPDTVWALGARFDLRDRYGLALNFAEEKWADVRPGLAEFHPVDFMPGNGVLLPRAVFEAVGLYDEVNLPQYHADSDLVLRAARAGFRPGIATRAVIYNHINTTPLVNNVYDLLYSQKSDRNCHALRTFYRRHRPDVPFALVAFRSYAKFFLPRWGRWLCRRAGVRL
jgi:GT2 family glycosyltransferase